MHPFVHSFNPAIAPPWQTRTDWDAFQTIADEVQRARRGAPRHPQGRRRRAAAARHPRRDGQPARRGPGLEARRVRAGPGRDDAQARRGRARLRAPSARKMAALGPLLDTLGTTTKGVTYDVDRARSTTCGTRTAPVRGGPADGRPSLERDVHACEAILALSGTTNGHLATQGFQTLEKRTGTPAARPGRRARGQADHLRRHPGRAGAGDHLAGVVRARRPAAGATRRSPSTSSGSSRGTR